MPSAMERVISVIQCPRHDSMLNMNKTKMDFLIGVAKALLSQHTPPQAHPCPAVFFSQTRTHSPHQNTHSDWIMALLHTGQELLLWRGPLSIAFITSITVPAPWRQTPSSNIFPMLSTDFVILQLCGLQPHLAIFTKTGSILVYMQHLRQLSR